MKNILIAGGSGLVGTRLTQLLQAQEYTVTWLTRTANKPNALNVKCVAWDINNGTIDPTALQNIDYIINLAGEGIADKRWTKERKKAIIESRIASTQLLINTLCTQPHNVKAFVSASAVGYYGATTHHEILTENTPAYTDFLGTCCAAWEKEIFKLTNIRTVALRIGIVLTNKGGALPQMAKPVKLFVGSALGTGKQYIPWIHIDDLCAQFIAACTNTNYTGVYNAVAPTEEQCTNTEFTKAMAKQLHRPFLPINVPAFILKIIVGEMAAVVLNGNKISNTKIAQNGFIYTYPTLQKALANLL
ncbi:MAG: TIGR01777 family protein [Bacteroidia bacterium]|nr:TIGR01777 family protein [Bacteroidia bacterium]